MQGAAPALLCPHMSLSGVLHSDWCPKHREDVGFLELVQRRAMKMIEELEHLSYDERLRKLSMFSLGKREGSGETSL